MNKRILVLSLAAVLFLTAFSGAFAAKKSAIAYYNEGVELLKKNMYDASIAKFDTSIKMAPNNSDAYYNMGNAYAFKGLFDKAIVYFTSAINLKKNAESYNNRGNCYFHMKDLNKAIADFNSSISLSPNNYRPYLNRALSFAAAGDFKKSMEDVKMVEKLGGKVNPVFLDNLNKALNNNK